MKHMDLIEIKNIVSNLLNEFADEESRLHEIVSENTIKMEEIEQQINNFRKNENIDFKVFSPREVSGVNNEKINALMSEKDKYSQIVNEAKRQLNYYSGKTDRLSRVLDVLEEEDKNAVSYEKKDISVLSISRKDNLKEAVKDRTNDDSKDNSTEDVKEKEPVKELKFDWFSRFTKDYEDAFPSEKTDEESGFVESENEVLENEVSDTNDSYNNKPEVKEVIKEVVKEVEVIKEVEVVKEVEVIKEVPVDGISTNAIEKLITKVEFTEKIIPNDRVRAQMELKKVAKDMKDLVQQSRID